MSAPEAARGGECAAEEAGGRARSRDRGDEGDRRKKMVSVPARRQQVAYAPGAWPVAAAGLHAVLRWRDRRCSYRSRQGREGCAGARADEGAVGAVSALRLSAHPHLPRPRRPSHELRPGAPAVASGEAAGAAQAADASALPRGAATPASADGAEPGVVRTTSCSTIAPTASSSSA